MADVSTTLDLADRTREADHPHSLVVRFAANNPLHLDAGVDFGAAADRLPDLRLAQRRAQQCGAGLPCADRRSACRQRSSGDRQAGLVGDHGRARPADRHRALFRHLPERRRRLHGQFRTGFDQSGDRHALGSRFSRHHRARHGPRAGDAARSSRHRVAVRGGRRLDGRHAGAAMGGELSAPRVRGAADRGGDTAFGAEHRLPRGRPPGGDGRSGLARRTLFCRRHQSAPRPRGGAHGRAHYLSVRRRAASQIRPPLPGPRQSDVLVRCRLSGRILSAPPGHHLRRAFRRQFVSLSDARDGLFRSCRRL